MKTVVGFIILVVICSIAGAAPKSDKASKKTRSSKEISFDEILVQGKHHFSDEAVVTVEQDKVLDALLEIPKDFKKRIRKSAKRN